MAWGKNKVRELRGERRVATNLADGEKEREDSWWKMLSSQGGFLLLLLFWTFTYLFGCTGSYLWHTGSVVAACKLFVLACDLFPGPGIEPGLPVLGVGSLSYWTTRDVPGRLLLGQWLEAQRQRVLCGWAPGDNESSTREGWRSSLGNGVFC